MRGENQPGRQIATKAHNQIVASPLVGHSGWFLSRMKQCPQETLKGMTTRSPGLMWVTAEPTSSTMPMGSWPLSPQRG